MRSIRPNKKKPPHEPARWADPRLRHRACRCISSTRADFAAWRAAQPAPVGRHGCRCAHLRRRPRHRAALARCRWRHRRRGARRRRPARSDLLRARAVRAAAGRLAPRQPARPGRARAALQLGWGLGSYRFSRYKQPPRAPARLLLEATSTSDASTTLAACIARARPGQHADRAHGPGPARTGVLRDRRALSARRSR